MGYLCLFLGVICVFLAFCVEGLGFGRGFGVSGLSVYACRIPRPGSPDQGLKVLQVWGLGFRGKEPQREGVLKGCHCTTEDISVHIVYIYISIYLSLLIFDLHLYHPCDPSKTSQDLYLIFYQLARKEKDTDNAKEKDTDNAQKNDTDHAKRHNEASCSSRRHHKQLKKDTGNTEKKTQVTHKKDTDHPPFRQTQ